MNIPKLLAAAAQLKATEVRVEAGEPSQLVVRGESRTLFASTVSAAEFDAGVVKRLDAAPAEAATAASGSPPGTNQYFRMMNVLCRVMGLWFVFVCSVAMLVPVFALIVAALGAKDADAIYWHSVKMIAGFGVGIALGGVALKVRSFRPDLPKPKQGQSTNWWTGDLVERGGKVV